MNVIEDHPEAEILQNPVWCLSEDKIIGFDKYLYSWDQSGEFLAKKRLPHQGFGLQKFHLSNLSSSSIIFAVKSK